MMRAQQQIVQAGAPAGLVAIHLGHDDVEQDDARVGPLQQRQALGAGADAEEAVAGGLDQLPGDVPAAGIVVDARDERAAMPAPGHGVRLPARVASFDPLQAWSRSRWSSSGRDRISQGCRANPARD
jgi:hypothetical protein